MPEIHAAYMKLSEFCYRYGVSRKSALRYIHAGRLPAYRPQGAAPNEPYRIAFADATAFMQSGTIRRRLLAWTDSVVVGEILGLYYEHGRFVLRRNWHDGHPSETRSMRIDAQFAREVYEAGEQIAPFPEREDGVPAGDL
jgi:hypothetical protein